MDRALAWIINSYFGLSVAHWWRVAQILHGPPGRLWCGNIITDPWTFLMNKLGPLAAPGLAASFCRRSQGRRRLLPPLVPPLFFGTTAALVLEPWLLRDFGLPIPRVWWFPWLGSLFEAPL